MKAPIARGRRLAAGEQVCASAGLCRESTGVGCDPQPVPREPTGCSPGESCVEPMANAGVGVCHRIHGSCAIHDDCSAGTCEPVLITAAAADRDADGFADPIDNCPSVPNPGQADSEVEPDGIGDACDAHPCALGEGGKRSDACLPPWTARVALRFDKPARGPGQLAAHGADQGVHHGVGATGQGPLRVL